MAAPVLEFVERARLDAGVKRHHALVRQRGAQQAVVVVRGFVLAAFAFAAEAAAAGAHVGVRRGKKFGHVQVQARGDLDQVVIGGRQQAVFDFRQRGRGNAGGCRRLLQGPIARLAQGPQPLRQCALFVAVHPVYLVMPAMSAPATSRAPGKTNKSVEPPPCPARRRSTPAQRVRTACSAGCRR
ncbi:hypothetical protein D3C71_1590540 [compost metagenome]